MDRGGSEAVGARESSEEPAPDNSAGDDVPPILNLSDIENLELVGEGATAQVYRGILDGEVVAVKKMDCHPSSMSQKGRVNLSRELRILHSIQHENLVAFYGVAVSGCTLSIVMEYCAGGAAFDLLHNEDRFSLSWTQRWKIAMDVAKAMSYLHSFTPQIIHRDLKSLNLLFKEAVTSSHEVPFVKVVDFGLSRMAEIQPDSPGVMTKNAGTPHWMAPEVFESNKYDRQVDVYSYSMILYELICTRIPFEEVSNKQRLGLMVCQGHRPNLEAVPEDCPEEFMRIMIKCWDQAPEVRPEFSAVVEMLSALRLPE